MDYMKVPFHLLLRQQKLYFKIIKNDLTNDLLPRVEGWNILDNRKGLFCSPTPLTNSFSPRESSILFNTSSLRCDAHEARQKVVIWKDSREEVDKAHNVNTP